MTELELGWAAAVLMAVVGLAVGAASSLTGLGAGLALPVLAALGLPMPAALLATKLPVALGDLSAAWGLRQTRSGGAGLSRSAILMAGVCGALAALVLLGLWPGHAAVACVALLLLALAAARAASSVRVACWGAYIGACGIGAGGLMRWAARSGPAGDGAERAVRELGAAANTGAVVVLLAGGQSLGPAVVWLALWQGAGAWGLCWWLSRGARSPRSGAARGSQAA